MTPAAELLQPDSNPALYVSAVLTLYVDLPDTPLRASASDQWLARVVWDRVVTNYNRDSDVFLLGVGYRWR